MSALTELLNGMADSLTDAVTSPWVYLAVFVAVCLDAVVPVFPSETIVIVAGVVSLTEGGPDVLLVVLVAAVAAFIGDHLAYAMGRGPGSLLLGRAGPRGGRWARGIGRAQHTVEQRPWQMLLTARFVPGGRTAVSMACGALRLPLRRFTPAVAVGSLIWAAVIALLGVLGGAVFEGDPLLAGVVAISAAVVPNVAVEVVRGARRRRARRRSTTPAGNRPVPQRREVLVAAG